ncbi:unnamed protein product [Rodentolepis nana]|uniref:Uncharacterized protein n=1 Tax=Rodentolepis nana TaxID=102285 RepID=A0A0R3U094_RODNA|nr:unnamed protein product [Rodentolepis nana]
MLHVITEPFRPCKLNAAIKQLNCKKSPCDVGMHPEFLIRMGPTAKLTMLTLFNKIWETSHADTFQQNLGDQSRPNQWVAKIMLVLKKGKDPSNFDNYRKMARTLATLTTIALSRP